jgi:DNA polymerase elongation subunit (family B)
MITQKINDSIYFHKTLIIDIETVPLYGDWNQLSEELKKHWIHKSGFLSLTEEEKADPGLSFQNRAGIYAEFGKVVCIGMGFIIKQNDKYVLRLKSIKNHDEQALLQEFCDTIRTFEQQHKEVLLCGHNIKEFDIPYICRRLLINSMPLPKTLDIAGLKPWQIIHQDTLDLWRFGDYKHYTSLDLLAQVLHVPSSKSDIDGSMVGSVYWQLNDLDRIASYCLRDIYTTTLVYLRLKGYKDIHPEAVYA